MGLRVAVCTLMFAIFAVMPRAIAADMEFRWVSVGEIGSCGRKDCPKVLEASGTISDTTPEEFRRFVASRASERGARRAVLLNSAGGDLAASMRLGIEFRRLGMIVYVGRFVDLETLAARGQVPRGRAQLREIVKWGNAQPVNGICYSACVYAFMGGVKRTVPQSSKLGVHRPTLIENTFFGIPIFKPNTKEGWNLQRIGELERTYLQFMGASPNLVALAHSIEPASIHVLTSKELRQFRLTTR